MMRRLKFGKKTERCQPLSANGIKLVEPGLAEDISSELASSIRVACCIMRDVCGFSEEMGHPNLLRFGLLSIILCSRLGIHSNKAVVDPDYEG